jgi:hypothetical protein
MHARTDSMENLNSRYIPHTYMSYVSTLFPRCSIAKCVDIFSFLGWKKSKEKIDIKASFFYLKKKKKEPNVVPSFSQGINIHKLCVHIQIKCSQLIQQVKETAQL